MRASAFEIKPRNETMSRWDAQPRPLLIHLILKIAIIANTNSQRADNISHTKLGSAP